LSTYKRKREWVEKYKFHIILKPHTDELLSSWLTRMAHAHGRSLSLFISSYIKNDGISLARTDIDFKYDEKLFKQLSIKSRLDIKTIKEMSLRSEEGYLFSCNDCLYPPKLIRKLIDKRTHNGLMFCPECLKEDKVVYFRKYWRYGFYNVCTKHKLFLVDRCWKCNAPVKYTKTKYTDEIYNCYKCGNDLRNAKYHTILETGFYSNEATEWFLNGLKSGFFVVSDEKIHSLWIFKAYIRLKWLLERNMDKLKLDNFCMIDDYLQICKKLKKYNSKKYNAIYKEFFLNAMVYHLFQKYPLNLKKFAKDNNLSHREFIHGLKDISFWYLNLIDANIPIKNTTGRDITYSEIQGAIKYLKNKDITINQKNVAEIIGCHFTINKQFVKIYKDIQTI